VTDGKRSFWSSIPGLITGLAGLLTGVVGLITLLVQQGVIGNSGSKTSSDGSTTTVTTAVTGGTSGTIVGGGPTATASGSFTLSPRSLDFPPADPKEKSVTVKNTGSAVLTGFQTSLSGPDKGLFSVVLGDCSHSLVANLSCTMTVTFTPKPGAALQKYAATLQVTATGATRGDEVALTASTLL
jgi:hypothetical protein